MRDPSARSGGLALSPGFGTIAAALLLLPALAPASVRAQQGCYASEGTELFVRRATLTFWTKPHFECEDGVEIWADSAVSNADLGMWHLMGSVRYVDLTRELRADTARYFSNQGRLQANVNVFISNREDGSQVENGDLVYLRQTDFRDVESMTVTTGRDGLRPRALVRPAAPESAAPDRPEPEPYSVVGDRIELRGGSYFRAVGAVEIEQDSLLAYADSAEFDREADELRLDGSARVISRDTELVGRTVTVIAPGADTSRIVARRDAVLTGEGLRMTSAQIVVFLVDGSLERLVAMPIARSGMGGGALAPGIPPPDSADSVRPVATLDEAELTADSLEVIAPGELVERVVAVGRARSVSTARDSLNTESLPDVARRDWLEGDTVIVLFGPAPGADSTRYEIETITAIGRARALYRLTPADSAAQAGRDPPALHYVVGTRIEIAMLDGDVDAMKVVGQTQGVHLEPLQRRVAPPDTARVRTDTLLAVRRTGAGPPAARGRRTFEPGRARWTRGQEMPWRRE